MLRYIRELGSNQRIPSRSFMCSKWRISRTTADKIVAELQREGVLYCVKGSGTFVSPQSKANETVSASGKHHWAIILPDVQYSVYPKAFSGIERFTRAHNIDFIICNTDEDVESEFAMVQRLVASNIDGFIIVPAITTTENFRNYQYLVRTGIPFVFWQRSVDYMLDIPQLLLNGYYGGHIATKHLLDMGYRRVAYLAHKRFRSSMDRYMGYCAALAEAGIGVDPALVRIGIPAEGGQECARAMLSQPSPPDAFVCYVDSLAVDVVRAVNDLGLRVSDDVGVLGFEGTITWLDSTLNFGLTYVDINRAASGWAAAEALYGLMCNQRPESMISVFAPTLCVRDSCRGKRPNP